MLCLPVTVPHHVLTFLLFLFGPYTPFLKVGHQAQLKPEPLTLTRARLQVYVSPTTNLKLSGAFNTRKGFHTELKEISTSDVLRPCSGGIMA